ncbi:MAG: hypothetical protein ACI8XO_001465 [Verrucomicrobiales bacterium]|jgi:hypothetical protein
MWWVFPYGMGFATATLLWVCWRALQLYLDLRITRLDTERAVEMAAGSEVHARAWSSVAGCSKRLRFRKELNPKWVAPLIEELPKMIREIATIYHPDEPEPLQAPKLSEFSRAVELTAGDISNFLQQRRAGRLVDLSAGSAWRTWEKTRDIAAHPKVRKAHKIGTAVYEKIRPVVQLLRYKSPLTWASIAVSNAAARTLQPAVVNIVGHRAIQLYSGELRRRDEQELEAPDVGVDEENEIEEVDELR